MTELDREAEEWAVRVWPGGVTSCGDPVNEPPDYKARKMFCAAYLAGHGAAVSKCMAIIDGRREQLVKAHHAGAPNEMLDGPAFTLGLVAGEISNLLPPEGK